MSNKILCMPTGTTKGATQNERLLFSAFCKEERRKKQGALRYLFSVSSSA